MTNEYTTQKVNEIIEIINNAKFATFAVHVAKSFGITSKEWNNDKAASLLAVYAKIREIEQEDNVEIIKNIIA
jgi:plasmid maintenance system antidote protein VapI